jgi:hypothetical protein
VIRVSGEGDPDRRTRIAVMIEGSAAKGLKYSGKITEKSSFHSGKGTMGWAAVAAEARALQGSPGTGPASSALPMLEEPWCRASNVVLAPFSVTSCPCSTAGFVTTVR